MDKQFTGSRTPMSFGTSFSVFWAEANYFLIQSSLSLTRRSKCITEHRNVLSPILYSILIDTIFLEPHIFFMRMCSSLVLSWPKRIHALAQRRKASGKRGNASPNSSLYADKNELLPYLGRHCYWMISHPNTTLSPCALARATFMTSRKHFSIALSASSTLLFCQKRCIDTERKTFIILCLHMFSGVRAGSKLDLASAFVLILSFRSTSFIASWIFY